MRKSTHSLDELRQRAERIISLPREEFPKMPVADIQGLLGDVVVSLVELETEIQGLHAAKVELEDSRRQSADLFDFAPVGYFNLDSRGNVSNINFTGSDMLGVSRAAIVNKPFLSLVQPQYHEAFRNYLKRMSETGYRLSLEVEMRRQDGSAFFAQLQAVALYEKLQMVYRVSVADISERKKAEQARLASEKRYRSFIEVTGELGWTTNADGEVVEDIPSFRRFTGQTYEEIRGRGWSKALHPDDLERTIEIWQKAVRDRGKYETEYRLRRYDGVYRDFLARGVPVFRENGTVLEWVGTCIDITDRKEAERAVRASEQKYRDLADFLAEGVFEAAPDGAVTYANRKALVSFNLSSEDLSKGPNVFEHVAPDYISFARERFARVLQGEDIGPEEYVLLRKDGSSFPAVVHSMAIVRDGNVQGIRGIVVDITERKRAEQACIDSENRLRSIMDAMLEGCVILDFNWRYLYANDAAIRLTRRTKEERIGRTMMEVFPGIEKQDTFAHLKRCMETRTPETYVTEFTFPEGDKVWFEVRVEPVPEGLLVLYIKKEELRPEVCPSK